MSFNNKKKRKRELALRCTTAATQDSPELVWVRDSLQASLRSTLIQLYFYHDRLVGSLTEHPAPVDEVALSGTLLHADTGKMCQNGSKRAPPFSCVPLKELRKVNFPPTIVGGKRPAHLPEHGTMSKNQTNRLEPKLRKPTRTSTAAATGSLTNTSF